MKKIILLSMGILFVFAVKAQQTQTTASGFTPEIFMPNSTKGIAYLENVQVNSAQFLTAYVYMYSKDGAGNNIVVKKTISGEIIKPPSHWPTEFYPAGSYDPQTMRYYSPKPIPFSYQAEYEKDLDGNWVLNIDGSRRIVEKITFKF